MSLETIYLWAISLLIIVSTYYFWLRWRKHASMDVQGDVSGSAAENSSENKQSKQDLFARTALFFSKSAGDTPSLIDSSMDKIVPVSIEAIRFPLSVLLIGSLLLVWMGQSIYPVVPEVERRWIFALMGFGGIAFLLAGQTAVRQRLSRWIILPLKVVGHYFSIEAGQIALWVLALPFVLLAWFAAGDVLVARNGFISFLAWLMAMGLAIVGSLDLKDRRKFNINRPEIVYTAVLFLVAFLLRGVATNVIPPNLSGDEGSAGLVSLMFSKGEANNLFTIGWFSFPSFYFAVQSIGIRIWGQTVEALRISSAFAGALAVFATYWMTRSLFDRKTAVIASLYLAASHYHMHMSRIGLNNIWDSLFGVVAIFGFWYGWRSGRRIGYVLCGAALGLGVYFYVSIRVLPVLFLFWAIAALLRNREQFKQRLPGMILAALIAFVIVLPLGIFFYRHPLEFNAPLNRVTILGPRMEHEMLARDKTMVGVLAEQAKLAALGFTQEPLRLLYDPGAPLLLTGAATLFLIGLAWSITHFGLHYLLIFLPLLGAIVSNMISQDSPASQRYVMAMPLVAVLLAVPLGQLGNWLDRMWPRVKNVGLIVTAVMITAVISQDIHYYFFEVYDTYVYGGINTQVATEIAHHLQEQTPAEQTVYFFGFPRMGYYSLSTIPYLLPEMNGIDVIDPLQNGASWELIQPTQFVFLPERLNELPFVQEAFPNGTYQEFHAENDLFLFAVYAIDQ